MVVRKKTERTQACSRVSFHSLEKREEGKLRKKNGLQVLSERYSGCITVRRKAMWIEAQQCEEHHSFQIKRGYL